MPAAQHHPPRARPSKHEARKSLRSHYISLDARDMLPSVAEPTWLHSGGGGGLIGRSLAALRGRRAHAACASPSQPPPCECPRSGEPYSPPSPPSCSAPESMSSFQTSPPPPAAASPGSHPAAAPSSASTAKAHASLLVGGPLAAGLARASDDAWGLMSSLPRTARTLSWAGRAARAYGAFLGSAEARALPPDEYAQRLSELHSTWAQRLLEVCRVNGGVYVKAGQFAAAFAAVPNEYRRHLALLQDKARPRPFAVVDRVIRRELGASAEEVFSEFHAEATAAASLAQVHRARLSTGEEVAVKVQYPGLARAAAADLSVLSALSAAAQRAFPSFRFEWLYQELRLKLEEELDFGVEVANSTRLMHCLASTHSGVQVPRVHTRYCTAKVLTMEWVEGHKVNDVRALRRDGVSPRAVGVALEAVFAEMLFVHGWVHADPHPGNIFVRPRGRRGLWSWLWRGSPRPFELVMLDHGSYLELTPQLRQRYCTLWCALFAGDRAAATEAAVELGGVRAGQILPVILTQRARNKEERERMQRAAGVASFGDVSQLLNSAPRDVVEVLRITAVVRSVTGPLGCTAADRLRINGTHALRGLPPGAPLGGGGGDALGRAARRAQVVLQLAAVRTCVALDALLNRLLLAVLAVFGQDVHLQ